MPTPDHYIGHLSYGVCESSLGCGKSSQAGRRKCATHTGLQDMPYIYTQEMSSTPTYIPYTLVSEGLEHTCVYMRDCSCVCC